ncbi:MAG TPA: hypothetical protein EYP92_02340 [Candidatus Thioglobus sp.]|jgi:hypothetical protein|nr:hypothetical protein [Candidatus Thioglobus sp.]HIL42896.1 hypothetical protein [Gammaproteobacteria bacterium]
MIKWILIVVLGWIAFVSLVPHVSVLNNNFTRLEAYDWCSNVNNVISSESSECFKYWSPVHHWG